MERSQDGIQTITKESNYITNTVPERNSQKGWKKKVLI